MSSLFYENVKVLDRIEKETFTAEILEFQKLKGANEKNEYRLFVVEQSFHQLVIFHSLIHKPGLHLLEQEFLKSLHLYQRF